MVKNRPHLVAICGAAAGAVEPVHSYGQILLEKVKEVYESGWEDMREDLYDEAKRAPSSLGLSSTEWSPEEDDILREAVRTLQDEDGACSSWSRVAQLVGNNRTAQPCRGRWRRLKKNDDKLGIAHVPTAAAKAAIRRLSAQLDNIEHDESAAAAKGKRTVSAGEDDEGGVRPLDETLMDRPGWTAAWSFDHTSWYWWNADHQTTWDDPGNGTPTIVPSEPVPNRGDDSSEASRLMRLYEAESSEEEERPAKRPAKRPVNQVAAGPLSDKVLAKLKKDPDAPRKPIGVSDTHAIPKPQLDFHGHL